MEPRLRGSVDSTSSTRGYPLRRGILAAAVYTNIGFLYPVQVDNRQFRILFSYLCSGWYRLRFRKSRWVYVFRFSLLGGWTVRACGYVVFCNGLS